MKSMKPGLILLALVPLMFASPVFAQGQVYKSVDENGNVVFTDTPPVPDAEPMDLPDLSVVETPEFAGREPTETAASQAAVEDAEPVMDMRDMRRAFRDFRIVTPLPDQTFWGTGQKAAVSWDTQAELMEGMLVVVYLDDVSMGASRDRLIATGVLERGEHSTRAELRDAQNRTIAETERVTFFVKQQSRLIRGGG